MRFLLFALLLTSVSQAKLYTGTEDCGAARAWPYYLRYFPSQTACRISLELTQTAAQGNQSWGSVVYTVGANESYRGTYQQTGGRLHIDFPGKTYALFRAVDVYQDANGALYLLTDMGSAYLTRFNVTANGGGGGNGGGGQGGGNGPLDMHRLDFDTNQILIQSGLLDLEISLEFNSYESLRPALKRMKVPAQGFRDCVFTDKLAIQTCIPLFKNMMREWEAFVPEFYAVHAQNGLEKPKRSFASLAEVVEKVRTQLKSHLN